MSRVGGCPWNSGVWNIHEGTISRNNCNRSVQEVVRELPIQFFLNSIVLAFCLSYVAQPWEAELLHLDGELEEVV